MKKSFQKRNPLLLFVALLSMTMFVSCSNNGPESVAKKFLEHTNKGELKEAMDYCDEGTGAILAMAQNLSKDRLDEMKNRDITIDIISSEINEEGDKATVKYKSTEETENGEEVKENEITLAKIEGDWKVSMDKEGMKKEN